MKLGLDSDILCYDNGTGETACQIACDLKYLGFQRVVVYNDDFKANYKKSEREQALDIKGRGTLFEFTLAAGKNKNYYTKEDFQQVVDGKSSAFIVDARTKEARKYDGMIEYGAKKMGAQQLEAKTVWADHKTLGSATF